MLRTKLQVIRVIGTVSKFYQPHTKVGNLCLVWAICRGGDKA